MDFKLLGSGDGGGQQSMGQTFSEGVPVLGEILDTAQQFMTGGFTGLNTRLQGELEANKEFVNNQLEANKERRTESNKRLEQKQKAMGTLASMLGEYDSMIEAMAYSDDEESQALLPIMMQGRARLTEAMRGGMSPATLAAFVQEEKSPSQFSPAKRSAQMGEKVNEAKGMTPKDESSAPKTETAQNTKSPSSTEKPKSLPSSKNIDIN